MANTLLTPIQITRESLRKFRNSNAFLQSISRQFDAEFSGEVKIGTTLKIRKPGDYIVRTGATASAQNTTQDSVTLTVATQAGVDVSFSSAQKRMELNDFGDLVLGPIMNTLAGGIAVDVMSGAEGIPNLTHAVDGANNTISPTARTWLQAGAILDYTNTPRAGRVVVMDPQTQANTVASLSGLFNSQEKIGRQYETGQMLGKALGFNWMMDQTVIQHTTGAYSTLGTVSGANQTGLAITTSALAGPLKAGDIVTFAGSIGVNAVTKATTGVLKQFVVTADVAGGATSIPIYPSLNPQVAAANVAYQTVVASPTNGGAIASPVNASEVHRKNFVLHPDAVTLVTADLPLPTGAVIACHRENYDGISMRYIEDFNSTTDIFLTRLDIFYGYKWVRPEWACVVADAV